jgi:hypothetical protein
MKIYVPSHSSRFQEYSHKYHLISGMKKAPGISARCFLLDFIQLLDALVRIESHDRLDTVYHASLFR